MDRLINVGLVGYGLGGRFFHAPIITSVKGLKLHLKQEIPLGLLNLLYKVI
jgi:hypothetical protein